MRFIFFILLLNVNGFVWGQKLSGQWTGDFGSNPNQQGQKTEYILELEFNGNDIKGFSYTYFTIGSKHCYVICKLSGNYDKDSKSMNIAEVEKIKSNTPPDFRDCLQKHELTYFKTSGSEVLRGKWSPVDPKSGCGSGVTELERKPLVKMNVNNSKSDALSKNQQTSPSTTKNNPVSSDENHTDLGKNNLSNTIEPKKSETAILQINRESRKSLLDETNPVAGNSKSLKIQTIPAKTRFEERSFQILKTIELETTQFKVELYDNGQIDGDTISLYLNGKLMISQKRLTTIPISLNISLDPNKEFSELVMYAENLGTIPPNTALMVVTAGEKRFELNISSSDMTNGTVRFKLKNH